MPTTGSGKFPYPNSSAVPDVPADVLLLAQRMDLIASGWTVCADATARAALVTNGDAYEGLHVYQIDTKVEYIYLSLVWVPWNSAWITYTTTLGQASGTFAVGTGGTAEKTSKYKYVAGRVCCYVKFSLGTSGASMGTTPSFTLPFNAVQTIPQYTVLGRSISIYDSSSPASLFQGQIRLSTSSQSTALIYTDNAGLAGITSAAPMTWASGDTIAGEFWFEAA